MKRRVIYGVVVLVLTANFLIGAHVYLHAAQAAQKDDPYPPIELFSFVIEKVRKEYVDGQKLTYRDLVYGALKGMLNTLDPHSEFMEPDKSTSSCRTTLKELSVDWVSSCRSRTPS